jgi:hypothetical protein
MINIQKQRAKLKLKESRKRETGKKSRTGTELAPAQGRIISAATSTRLLFHRKGNNAAFFLLC